MKAEIHKTIDPVRIAKAYRLDDLCIKASDVMPSNNVEDQKVITVVNAE